MAAQIRIVISETGVDWVGNASSVKLTVQYYGNGVSWNSTSSSHGTLTVNGRTYSFRHTFTKSKSWQTLYSVTIGVGHDYYGYGSVSASAKFVTDVSLGTLKTSNSASLTYIDRIHRVYFNANGDNVGNMPGTVDKVYGYVLTLPGNTPTRTNYKFMGWATSPSGGVSYYPGSQWGGDYNITLYAVWELQTAALTYNLNGYGTNFSGTLFYNSAYYLAGPGNNVTSGYTFTSWNTKSDGSGTTFHINDRFKDANTVQNILGNIVIPASSANTLYAICTHDKYENRIIFNAAANGGTLTGIDKTSVQFKTTLNNKLTGQLSAERQYYYLDGWYTTRDDEEAQGIKIFDANGIAIQSSGYWENGLWSYAFKPNETLTLYARFTREKKVVGYLSSRVAGSSYVEYTTMQAEMGADYTIPIGGTTVPTQAPNNCAPLTSLENNQSYYYWSVNSLLDSITYNNEVYPQNVVPFNYPVDTLFNQYLNVVKKSGTQLSMVLDNQKLYTIYRDQSPSRISCINEDFKYVNADYINQPDCLEQYFNYLTNSASNIESSFETSSQYFVGYFKFKTTNDTVYLDTDNIVLTPDPDWSLETFPLNGNILVRPAVENKQLYYYVLIRNSGFPLPADGYETISYSLTLSGVKDTIGKTVYTNTPISIKPPIIVFDVNSAGTEVCVFHTAKDHPTTNVLDVHGEIQVYGVPIATALLKTLYPIGTIYETILPPSQFNPNTAWGIEWTWTQIEGKVLVGLDSNDADFNAPGKTGGSKAAWKHRHTMTSYYDDANYNQSIIPSDYGPYSLPYDAGSIVRHQYSDFSGSESNTLDVSKANMPPYEVVTIWMRTA